MPEVTYRYYSKAALLAAIDADMAWKGEPVKTLGEVVAGDLLDYGAYGVCKVESTHSYLGGWNGQVPLTDITFTCGLGFTAASDRPARLPS